MTPHGFRSSLLALAALFALVPSAEAVKTVEDATNVARGKQSLAHIYNASGANIDNNSFGGGPMKYDRTSLMILH